MPARPLLFDFSPDTADAVPWVDLGAGPTPVESIELPCFGTSIWVKRDDQAGVDYGGNKVRKLEFLLGKALEKKSSGVITIGAYGTHHGYATARYAARLGLESTILLIPPVPPEGQKAAMTRLELAGALPVDFLFPAPRTFSAVLTTLKAIAGFGNSFWIPPGGTDPTGALGFLEASLELAGQVKSGEIPAPAIVVAAAGSCGTAAGLLAGSFATGLEYSVYAVAVTPAAASSRRRIISLARKTLSLAGIGTTGFTPEKHLLFTRDFLGKGYGRPTPECIEAIKMFSEIGITLEPTYTGKAAAALQRLTAAKDGPVLFWQTFGGA